MKTITVIFGIWVLASGFLLLLKGWSVKPYHSFGWIIVLAGVISVIAAVMIIFNIGTGAIIISTLLGLQVLFTGIALVLLSLTKKILANKIKDKIGSINR